MSIPFLPFSQGMKFSVSPAFSLLLKSGKYVDLTKVIPDGNGLVHPSAGTFINRTHIDGRKVRLGPRVSYCRAQLCNGLKYYYETLHTGLVAGRRGTAKMVYKGTDGPLGILPYYTAFSPTNAGILSQYNGIYTLFSKSDFDTLVLLLDAVLANLCVMIDKAPKRARKASDYLVVEPTTTNAHRILEYRTLSSFYHQSYQLVSLVTGMARFCVSAAAESMPDTKVNYAKLILDAVPRARIVKAIEDHDAELAMDNWLKIEPIIIQMMDPERFGQWPLRTGHIKALHHFIKRGVDHWFKDDELTHWRSLPECHGRGWEGFLVGTVTNDMNGVST